MVSYDTALLPMVPHHGDEKMFGWKMTIQHHHRSTETTGAFDGGRSQLTHGLMAGTNVASNLGWRAIDALAVGDKVLTFDNGMKEITEIRRASMWLDAADTDEALWPVIVPAEVLGNRDELVLLGDQGVLVESDAVSDAHGDPFAVIPACALVGVRGIHRRQPQQHVELIAVHFEKEQIIYAEGGALLHCPRDMSTLDKFLDQPDSAYDVLSIKDAAFLAECLVVEDQITTTGGWTDARSTVMAC